MRRWLCADRVGRMDISSFPVLSSAMASCFSGASSFAGSQKGPQRHTAYLDFAVIDWLDSFHLAGHWQNQGVLSLYNLASK